jgi:hypothetical protein
MRKKIALFIAMIMIFSPVTVRGADAVVEICTAIAQPGGTATLNVRISNNPGFANMVLRVEHPPELTLTQYLNHVCDEFLFEGIGVMDGHFFTTWMGMDEDFENDGVLISLTFSVSSCAALGMFLPVTASFYNDIGEDPPVNSAGEEIFIYIEHGGVNVQFNVPPTGVPSVTAMMVLMLAFLAVSVVLWGFVLRRVGKIGGRKK